MMKAVVLDGYTLTAKDLDWEALKGVCDLTVYDASLPHQVVQRSHDAEIVLTNKVVLGKKEFDMLPKCKYVGVLATGYNVVDIEEAKKRGIVVTNIPSYSADSASQLIFAFILNFTFHVREHSEGVHNGLWCESKHFCYHSFPLQEISDKTLGVAGFGDIGSRVANIASAFGMNVLVYNRSKKNLAGVVRAKQVQKDELFSNSDFLSLCLPLNAETEHFINAFSIKMLKKGAYIINTSRGGLVDENIIAQALKDGSIAGYAADVLCKEPADRENPLLKSSAVITPHIAWQTYEARKRLMDIAVKNVKAFIEGKPINRIC